MRADFFIVGDNPFDVPITHLHRTRVLSTYIDGERVFEAKSDH